MQSAFLRKFFIKPGQKPTQIADDNVLPDFSAPKPYPQFFYSFVKYCSLLTLNKCDNLRQNIKASHGTSFITLVREYSKL